MVPDPMTPTLIGREWHFPNGKILPLVSGGDGEDPDPDPSAGGDAGENPDPDPDPDGAGDDPLGAGGKKALDSERKARRDAEKQLRDAQSKLKKIEDAGKSETDKLREQVAELTKDRDGKATAALRAEVAMDKGLTAAQAKRLVGATKEEMEADADELLETFGANGAKPPPSNKPKPNLKGGGDPTGDDPVDSDALAEKILARRSF